MTPPRGCALNLISPARNSIAKLTRSPLRSSSACSAEKLPDEAAMQHPSTFVFPSACETRRKHRAQRVPGVIRELCCGMFLLAVLVAPLRATQPEPSSRVAGEAAPESHEEGGRGAIDTVAR